MTNPNGWPDADHPGVPLNPERNGAHVLLYHDAYGLRAPIEMTLLWTVAGEWINEDGEARDAQQASYTFSYLGPCLTPAEVEAKAKAARQEGIEEAARLCDKRGGARTDDVERYRTHADRREAFRCATAIRALKETPND